MSINIDFEENLRTPRVKKSCYHGPQKNYIHHTMKSDWYFLIDDSLKKFSES